jgi:para-nitrobenzyl esterase
MSRSADAMGAREAVDLNRRAVLKGATLVAAAGASAVSSASVAQSASRASSAASSSSTVTARAGVAVVEVESGKIAGYTRGGIFAFKGIPYGDTTEGANRFSAPRKPKSWTGVRSSRQYGFVAPQDKGTGRHNDEEAFMFQWNDSVEHEDCLRVNVWTPGINDNNKRPVMVWLHGGGFAAGSGHDLPAFDGENLARRGGVVVVTLNHRLNVLGFLDLSAYGEKYLQSGNVGMLDIVAALQWVRNNIAVFGGDAQRVLIFGQSGGGAKVSTLMGMPSAKGLFHRAVVQSGSFAFSNTTEKSQKLADLILSELGVGGSAVDRLQTVPYEDLRRASEAAMRKANQPMGSVIDLRRAAAGLSLSPVVDGGVLPASPFNPVAPDVSADVPMIIGTTLNEFATGINHPEYELMSEAEVVQRTEGMFPGKSQHIVAAFRSRTPQAKPFDVWSRIASSTIRHAALRQAAAKATLNKAPAYLYWFTWHTPVFDGRPRAFHCAELPFVFYNTDRCETMTGGGPAARGLGAQIADAWIQFARTGDPNHSGLPQWPMFSPRTVPTMNFNTPSELLLDPDKVELASTGEA